MGQARGLLDDNHTLHTNLFADVKWFAQPRTSRRTFSSRSQHRWICCVIKQQDHELASELPVETCTPCVQALPEEVFAQWFCPVCEWQARSKTAWAHHQKDRVHLDMTQAKLVTLAGEPQTPEHGPHSARHICGSLHRLK